MGEAAVGRPSRAARAVLALDRVADRPWFLPTVAAFPLADYVVPFLPNQVLLAVLSGLRPRLWWRLALVFVLAGGLGAFAAAAAIGVVGPKLLETFGGLPESGAIAEVRREVQEHGLWALTVISLLPPTPRGAVLVCAMSGLPPTGIGLAVAAGRTLPAFLLAAMGAAAPHVLRRLSAVDHVMLEVEAAKSQTSLPSS